METETHLKKMREWREANFGSNCFFGRLRGGPGAACVRCHAQAPKEGIPRRRMKLASSNSRRPELRRMLWLVVLLGGSGGTGGIRGALGGKRCDVVIPTLNPSTTTSIDYDTCDEGMFAHREDGEAKRR